MARKHGRGRGISFGTILMLVLCLVVLAVGGFVFTHISGDIDQISIDPKLLVEPLTMIAHSVTDTEPAPTALRERSFDTPPPVAQATAAPTQTPVPTLPPSRTVTLTAVGQVSAGSSLRASGRDQNGAYNFTPAFSDVAAYLGADLSIATLRTVLGEEESAFDTARAPYNLATGLNSAGVTMFNLATDRVLDHGAEGVKTTLDILQQLGYAATGAYRSEQERSAGTLLDYGSFKVGLLPFTQSISKTSSKNASEADIATATYRLDAQGAAAQIAALRSAGADLVVVLPYWGSASDAKPSNATREMADALVNAGADIILGTGPTAVHEIERRQVTDSAGQPREVFIAYSLGNFIVDDSRDTSDITGVILHMAIEWDPQTRRAAYSDAWYAPTWIMRWKDGEGVNRYRVVAAGSADVPADMTDSIYGNMKKAYQNMVTKLGTDYARPNPAQ